MKQIYKKISLMCASVVLGNILFAQATDSKLKSIISEDIYSKLLEKGNITVVHDDGTNDLVLMPETEYSEKINNLRVTKNPKNFPFVYESLNLVHKKDLEKSSGKEEQITISDISSVLRSNSKMEGMKYYSTTKKKTLVLYEKAYSVEKENSKTKVADKNTGNADNQVSYSYQKDNSFGDIFYKLNYYQKEDKLLSIFTTTSSVGLGPFKAIAPGDLKIFIYVADVGEDFIIYLATDLDSVKFPGIKEQISDSMTSRIDAVFNWFLTQF